MSQRQTISVTSQETGQDGESCDAGDIVISGGSIEGDNKDSRKVNVKRARHEVMMRIVWPSEEKSYTVSFSLSNRYDILKHHADPLVRTTLMFSFRTCGILVDAGSLIDVLKRMGTSKDRLKLVNTSLVGLVGNKVSSLGTIYLMLTLGEEPRYAKVDANWLMVDCGSAYNCILGRPSLVAL